MSGHDARSMAAGGFLATIGGGVVAVAVAQLDMGTAFQMGPGYFPVMLGGLLLLLGGAIFLQAARSPEAEAQPIAWRAAFYICLAPLVFAATVRGLGFVPAIAVTAFVSTLASSQIGFKRAIVVSAGLTLFCTIVFSYGLGLSFRLVGPWWGG